MLFFLFRTSYYLRSEKKSYLQTYHLLISQNTGIITILCSICIIGHSLTHLLKLFCIALINSGQTNVCYVFLQHTALTSHVAGEPPASMSTCSIYLCAHFASQYHYCCSAGHLLPWCCCLQDAQLHISSFEVFFSGILNILPSELLAGSSVFTGEFNCLKTCFSRFTMPCSLHSRWRLKNCC